MEVSYGRGDVYSIQYHIVWCVKYRHQILNQDIEEILIEILTEIADNEGFKILEYNTDMDHIHFFINCTPQHYIPNIIRKMKGISSRYLMNEYKHELSKKLWCGHLGNPSYFVATVSENTEKQIRCYIKNQKGK